MFLFLQVFLFLEGWIYKMKYKTTTRLTFKLFSVFTNFLPNIFSSNFYCGCTKCLVDNTPSSANTQQQQQQKQLQQKKQQKYLLRILYVFFLKLTQQFLMLFNHDKNPLIHFTTAIYMCTTENIYKCTKKSAYNGQSP